VTKNNYYNKLINMTFNICKEIKTKLKERGEHEVEQTIPNTTSSGHEENEGLVGSTIANLVVIVGFAAFAYTVKCVIRAVGSS
jgi:hypothetical protein